MSKLVYVFVGVVVVEDVVVVLFSNVDLSLGNDGLGEGGIEEVVVFIDGVVLDGVEDNFFDKFVLEVFNYYVFGIESEGFFFDFSLVFFLVNIGEEVYDSVILYCLC